MASGRIQRAAQGDGEALAQLYEQYGTAVLRTAYGILREQPAAEDVLQETFLRVRERAGGYRGGSERAYLTAIARNLALTAVEKRRREEPLPDAEEAHKSTGGPEEKFAFFWEIDPLPPLEREIVTLHLAAGLRHREIAAVLNMSVSSVKKRYERAIAALRIRREWEERGMRR